jgi:hypothetical protein
MIKAVVFTILVTLNSFDSKGSDTIPEMNRTIVEYVNSVMDTQVDRGECWDLAHQALNRVDASWDGVYKYGSVVNYKKDPVYPGDIIHFKNVTIKQTEGFTTTTQTMEQHTAIVLKVYAVGVYELAHQNTNFSGRKVGTSPIDLNGLVKGKITVYRPTK